MKNKNSVRLLLFTAGGIFTVVITMAAVFPLLRHMLKVEIPEYEPPKTEVQATLSAPQEELLTVIYQMDSDKKRIDAVYIEVFRPGEDRVDYLQIPADTKLSLSPELYAALQTYAPELPQYMKLSRMAEAFSKEYAPVGCNRILSELLGVSLEHYIRAEQSQIAKWMDMLNTEVSSGEFFTSYVAWLEAEADLSLEERFMYFESYQRVTGSEMETAIGTQGADGYNLSTKQTGEQLEVMRSRLVEVE